MRRLYLTLRCGLIWAVSCLHFFTVCTFLVLLGILVDPRWNDRPQRVLCRNIVRLAGVRFAPALGPGFDPDQTSIFICNHVNIFDAFVVYCGIPQFVRGLELESHFKIPVYGWMMSRFGNIPVSRGGGPSQFKTLLKRVRSHLQDGISVVIFAEGSRTLDGRVGPFQKGAFVIAQRLGAPIVPMSICGSFQFCRKGSLMLYPSRITVHLHDAHPDRGTAPPGHPRPDGPGAPYHCRACGGEPAEAPVRPRLQAGKWLVWRPRPIRRGGSFRVKSGEWRVESEE